MARETLAVHGLKPLIKDFASLDAPVKRELRQGLRDVGDVIKTDAANRFSPVNSRSAAGYKVRVRQKGIAVEQSIRKTTGEHPEYGSLQMRKALLPALMSNQDVVEKKLEAELDRIGRAFERRG